jgi:hypothetical protein
MCDPISLIMGGLSIAGQMMSNSVQQKAIKKQENANLHWMQYQQEQRRQANLREEQLRGQTEQARAATVQDMSAQNQEKARSGEETRLNQALLDQGPAVDENPEAPGLQADVNAHLLAGSEAGGQEFQNDMASRISKATSDARARVKALAAVQSFGGTQGGLQTRNALELQQGEQGINMFNNFRQGSLSAFDASKGVTPIQYSPVSDPWGGIAKTLAGVAGQRMGSSFMKA